MTSIDHFNLRSFDLNLLLAFDAMMQERSVTRAAARMRIQQPAMSHALATLRMLLRDDVFVRGSRGMEPTQRAERLAPIVRQMLESAQTALLSPVRFEPATEVRTFRVGMSDQLEVALLPALMSRCQASAPGVRALVRATDRQQFRRMLDEGSLDIAVGYFDDQAPWLHRETLYDETHMCVFNPELLSLPDPVDLGSYLAAPHAAVSSREDLIGYMEAAFVKAGISRNVVLATPHFLSLAFIAKQSPLVATLPTRIARYCARSLGLAAHPVPFALDVFPVAMVWHSRTDTDPAVHWFRDLLRSCAAAEG